MAQVFDNNINATSWTDRTKTGYGTYCEDLNDDGVCNAGDPGVNWFGFYDTKSSDPYDGNDSWVKGTNIIANATAPVIYDTLYDYGSTLDNFEERVDLSIAGQMRDCAECHVGGGSMEYIPTEPGTDLSTTARTSLRDKAFDHADFLGGNYTTYNYFIGQYEGFDAGKGGDVTLGDVEPTNYTTSGVMEMDCLICHMDGYSWENRKDEIRHGRFDASRAVGAGIASAAVNGTAVTYNGTAVEDVGGNWTLSTAAKEKIAGTPPDKNCSSCHFDTHQVDWKKRGTLWTEEMAYQTEVHQDLGCMGCHDPGDAIASDGGSPEGVAWTGKANGISGHDPAKGQAPFSGLWNANDGSIKTCENCHVDQVAGNHNATNPTAAHEAAGLTAVLCQDGRDGTQDASHLDVIDCAACHTKKLGITSGGAMVDSTGPDAHGRLTDHENNYVTRSMDNNLCYAWDKTTGKLTPRNLLTTIYWVNKASGVDINNDGVAGDKGKDAVSPMHVINSVEQNGLEAMTADGNITAGEFTTHQGHLVNYLDSVGLNGTGASLKIAYLGVLFQANHNTSPANQAWGAGGCSDCHGEDAGFYNGDYEVKPDNLEFQLTGGPDGQITAHTRTNFAPGRAKGHRKPTDVHPTTFAKALTGRYAIDVRFGAALAPVDRSEFLYAANTSEANNQIPARIGVDGNAYTTRDGFVAYLNGVNENPPYGIHQVHTANDTYYGQNIACDQCHVAPGAGNNYTVNASASGIDGIDYKYPPSYNATGTEQVCTEWGVDDDGNFTCEEYGPAEPVGVLSCDTIAGCHGSTGSERYSGYQVDANFSALPSWDANSTTVNATKATCAAWREVNATHEQYDFVAEEDNCTYNWDFNGGSATYLDSDNASANVTWSNSGTYTIELTMVHKADSSANNTQSLNVTVPYGTGVYDDQPDDDDDTHNTRW